MSVPHLTLDLSGLTTKADLHMFFKRELAFEDWYGVSWDAFWDSIVAIADMPVVLTLQHWQDFAAACPRDMKILREVIADYNDYVPSKRIELDPPA
ncbi:barstar family protein [Hymenobacter aerilatus]|uniref:Barstar family protein n=1 Tax=Hymenobacter aerilatus TaxID=2932251 RepID=A0A8T9SUX9_9BACT|nr:barstar family protein [Hymenobacter aerilatus]UOR05952.1 barstar family protein [Hymenobacter aerilatus]